MLTDGKAGRMFLMLHSGHSVAAGAERLKMGERTIRYYRDARILPSQRERRPREYRTRKDPLQPFWPEIEELLEEDSQLRPFALLDWLKQKYNDRADGQSEVRITDSIRFDGRWSGEFSNGSRGTESNRKSSSHRSIIRGT